jgi:DNA-binding NarL/FixJ family response regulator
VGAEDVAGTVIKVGIADDHPLAREGLVQLLETAEDVRVVGEASDGSTALEMVDTAEDGPDIILLDVRMPDIDGLEVARRITEEHPAVGVIMLSAYDDRRYMESAVRAGARGYVLKTADAEKLIRTVRLVASGHMVIDPQLVWVLNDDPADELATVKTRELTEREVEVLKLLAGGFTNKQIAENLGISPKTVNAHLVHIFQKLGASDRTSAVAEALRRGVID